MKVRGREAPMIYNYHYVPDNYMLLHSRPLRVHLMKVSRTKEAVVDDILPAGRRAALLHQRLCNTWALYHMDVGHVRKSMINCESSFNIFFNPPDPLPNSYLD